MKTHTKLLLFILLFLLSLPGFAQTNKEKALELCQEAIMLMDKGKIDTSIGLLNQAIKLDPENFIYRYEIALALYQNKDYKATIKVLKKLKKHKNCQDLVYQLLGNTYDVMGNPEKALKTYDEGLKIYPNSGKIYLEKGSVYMLQNDLHKALSCYDQGIDVEPAFPSNYYRAATLYCSSNERVWGIMYGEIFLNLESNSSRTKAGSKLLYETYKSAIQFMGDSTSISFYKPNHKLNISYDTITNEIVKWPFGFIYEMLCAPSIAIISKDKTINIHTLSKMREGILEQYNKTKDTFKISNVLFDYQNRIKAAGHLEAYNYWILMQGNPEEFDIWYWENQDKWNKFAEWFSENKLTINDQNKFVSFKER